MMEKGMMMALVMTGALIGAAAPAAALSGQDWIEGVWQARGDGTLKPADGKPIPFKPVAAMAWNAQKAAFVAGDPKVDFSRRCKPPGEPRLMSDPRTPFAVIVTKPRVLFAYQWNRLVRMIEMEAPREVIGPVYFGQNAGHWEGEVLVVDVQALHPNTGLDRTGLPHGEKARLTERFRSLGARQMEATITIDDPATYTAPWTARVVFDRQPGLTVKEDICLDRENLAGKLKQ